MHSVLNFGLCVKPSTKWLERSGEGTKIDLGIGKAQDG